MIAIHNLDIPYRFPAAVLKEAEQDKEASLKGREDWREVPLVTIDPPDAKDHDDAVYAEPSKDGGHVFGSTLVSEALQAAGFRMTPQGLRLRPSV